MWTQKIYSVKFKDKQERDVQWVFINSMKLKDNTLIITNERGTVYHLDLKTRKVKIMEAKF